MRSGYSLTSSINRKLYLKIAKNRKIDISRQISPILRKYKGDIPVILYLEASGKQNLANRELWIRQDKELIEELSRLLGKECVKLV